MKKALSLIICLAMLASVFPIGVLAASADDIVSITASPVTVYEKTNGYYDRDYLDYDEETCEDVYTDEYWRYDTGNLLSRTTYTVEFSDGTAQSFDSWDLRSYFDYNYGINYDDDQSYENQWDVGEHSISASFAGKEFTFSVTIAESPIKSITASPVTFYEKTNGYYTWDSFYDEDIDDWVQTNKYWYYDAWRLMYRSTFTVEFTDGTTLDFGPDELREYYNYEYDLNYNTDQTYNNQWDVGEHGISASFAGKEFTIPVMIEESPIKSITASPVTVYEKTNGYYDRDSFYDEDIDDWVQTDEYWYYDAWSLMYRSTFTVEFTDGTTLDFSPNGLREYYNYEYDLNYNADQTYNNQWDVGEHSITASFFGKEFTVPVIIEESPIKSITASPVTLYENTCGSYDWDWLYYDDDIGEWVRSDNYWRYSEWSILNRTTFTVEFTDSTTKDLSYDGLRNLFNYEYDVNISANQSYDNQWVVGDHTAELSFFGNDFTLNVTIVESPKPVSIEILTLPDRTYYFEGNLGSVSLYGMRVKAVWSDGAESQEKAYGYPVYLYHPDSRDLCVILSPKFNDAGDAVLYSNSGLETVIGLEKRIPPVAISAVYTGELIENWDSQIYGNPFNYTLFEYTLTMPGGDIVKCDAKYINDRFGQTPGIDYDRAELDTAGVHTGSVSLLGISGEFTYEVSPTPVESVEFSEIAPLDEDMKIAATYYGADGYTYPIPCFRYKVNLKNGDSYEDYYDPDKRAGGDVELAGASSYDYRIEKGITVNGDTSTWTVGGENTVTVCILGYTATFSAIIENGVGFEYFIQNDEVYITKYAGDDENVVIPSEIGGFPVVGVNSLLGNYDRSTITSITFPDSVKYLGDNIFRFDLGNGGKIKSIHFGKNVSKITTEMLSYCIGVENIEISEENPYFYAEDSLVISKEDGSVVAYAKPISGADVTVEDGVTYNRSKTVILTCARDKAGSYVMPDTVKVIADSAFAGCNNLTDVKVSSSVTSIGYRNFTGCSGLKNVELPSSVKSIVDGAFQYCSSLEELELPAVETVGEYAFAGCTSLTSVSLSANLTSFSPVTTFYGCTSIGSLTVAPGNAKYHSSGNCIIETETKTLVLGCKESVIPDDGSVTRIGSGAFNYCTGLTSITIPSAITEMGSSAFGECYSLQSVYIPDIAAWCGITFDYSSNPLSYADEMYVGNVLTTDLVIPAGVTEIAAFAFSGCSSLTSVVVPGSVTAIGDRAFMNCASLASVDLPNSLTEIGYSVFSGCSSLTSFTVPAGLTEIPDNMFSYTGLTGVTIPAGVISIGNGAFSGCSSLENVDLQGSLTSIGDGAFSGCSSLTSFDLTDGLTYIGGSAFSGCSSLAGVVIPDSVESIGGFAFNNTAITSIIIPDKVTEIMYGTFYCCYKLESVTIGNGVTNIGESAFAACSSLTEVHFGTGLKSIGVYAFEGCRSLTNVDLPVGLESLAYYVFSNSGLTDLTLPDTVTSFGTLETPDLERLELSSSVTDIVYMQFSGASALKDIVIPDNAINIVSNCNIETTAWYGDQEAGQIYLGKNFYSYKGTDVPENVVLKDGTLTIADDALAFESGIKSVTMPDTVTRIGKRAFSFCKSIKEIDLPADLVTIDDWAFQGCSGLTEITIPRNVKYIGFGAFWKCSSLRNIYVDDDNEYYKSVDGVLYSKDGSELIYCPMGKTGQFVVPGEVAKISAFAFADSSLRSIEIMNRRVYLENRSIGFSALAIKELRDYSYNHTNVQTGYNGYKYDVAKRAPLIIGYEYSTAEDYAYTYGLAFDGLELTTSGVTPEGIAWSYDPDSATLTLSGSGILASYGDDAPWAEFDDEIEMIVFKGEIGITNTNFLSGCSSLEAFCFEGSASEWAELAGALAAAFPDAEFEYSDAPQFEPGDMDGDGEVTMKDVLVMRRYIAGLDELGDDAILIGDIDGDGDITMKDVLKARRIIAGLD